MVGRVKGGTQNLDIGAHRALPGASEPGTHETGEKTQTWGHSFHAPLVAKAAAQPVSEALPRGRSQKARERAPHCPAPSAQRPDSHRGMASHKYLYSSAPLQPESTLDALILPL